jgi:hypothetical protein
MTRCQSATGTSSAGPGASVAAALTSTRGGPARETSRSVAAVTAAGSASSAGRAKASPPARPGQGYLGIYGYNRHK